jgi:hypothetical protein
MAHYGTTTLATPMRPGDWRVRALRTLLWFIPSSNPDNEPLYPQVARWVLEIGENGRASREIGLNASGFPLFGAPNARNFGFFTDSNTTFSRADLTPVEQSEFEKWWSVLPPNKSLERTREG